jgi:hypothetical protein
MSFMSSGFDGARASLARRPQESIPRGSIEAPAVVRHACLSMLFLAYSYVNVTRGQ